MESAQQYARFAAAAGEDILNGAPLRPFVVLNRLDESALRYLAHELRAAIVRERLQIDTARHPQQ